MTNTAITIEAAIQQANLQTIDHMTHIKNLESILANGLHAHGNKHQQVDISNQDVNSRRAIKTEQIHNRSLHDYVPFYFNPRNAMLYKTTKEHGDLIVILGFSPSITQHGIVTDGNAANDCTYFGTPEEGLSCINWMEVFSDSWFDDQERKRQMMAEVLIPHKVSIEHLTHIFCASDRIKEYIDSNFSLDSVEVMKMPHIFFQGLI